MTQTRPRRVITRPISTRAPPNRQVRKNLNPNYAYSPRSKIPKSNDNLNQNFQAKSQHSKLLAAYGVYEKPKKMPKKQENTNWISYLNDITYTSQGNGSTSSSLTPPAASLLFPSPTSPVTRTPEILRQIIDDSGFKILRESPLSAKDSYYAKDINDPTCNNNQSNFENQVLRPYSMRYSNNTNKENDSSKTFISNKAKSERNQHSAKQIITEKDNLNADSNLNAHSKSSSSNVDKNSERTQILNTNFEKEMEDQQKKKADLEKLLDMSDFDLDKFDNQKLDSNDDVEINDINIDDIKIDLDENDEKITKSASIDLNQHKINIQPNNNSNSSTKENSNTQKVKLPTESSTNQSQNFDVQKFSFKLNQTANSQLNQTPPNPQDNKISSNPEIQQRTSKKIDNYTNDLILPKTAICNSNSSSSKNSRNNEPKEQINADNQQKKQKADFDKLFDLTDFNLDGIGDSKQDIKGRIEIDKIELDDKDEKISKQPTTSNSNQASIRPNINSNENGSPNTKQKVKLPTEQPSNQARNSPKTANPDSKSSSVSNIKDNDVQPKAISDPSYKRESDSQRRRRADYEKLFELPDIKMAKKETPKQDTENFTEEYEYEYEEEDVGYDDIEDDLDVRPNIPLKENHILNDAPKVKLPTEKPSNQPRNLNAKKAGLNLNQTTIPLNSENTNSPQTVKYYSIPESKITARNYSKIDGLDDDESSYYSTSSACEVSDDPYSVDIFGDMSSFLYPDKNRNSKANSKKVNLDSTEMSSQNSEEYDQQLKRKTDSALNTSLLSSKRPLRSSFKGNYDDAESEKSAEKSERKSVKFIMPE